MDTFDTLYETLNAGDALTPAFWRTMRDIQKRLAPEFMRGVRLAQKDQRRWAGDVRALVKAAQT